VLGDVVPGAVLALIGLDAKELLLVVPLVERARLVEALVALQAYQVGREQAGQDLGDLGLACARGPFGEERLLEGDREPDRRLDARGW
jgi:hypothetical protein